MKKYKEDFINPDTGKKEEIEVQKFTFEDFINPDTGKKEKIEVQELTFEDFKLGSILQYKKMKGKKFQTHFKLDGTKEYFYQYLSEVEFNKIENYLKTTYESRVITEENILKNNFLKKYNESIEKELLIEDEIKAYDYLLFDKDIKSIKLLFYTFHLSELVENTDYSNCENITLGVFEIKQIREMHSDLRQGKTRDYHCLGLKSVVVGMLNHIKWLKDFKDNSIEGNETSNKNDKPINALISLKDNSTEGNKITNKKPKPTFAPKLFKDIFKNPKIINECLELLRETEPATIDEFDKFLKNRTNIIRWFLAVEQKALLNVNLKTYNQKKLTLQHNFKNLEFDDTLFSGKKIYSNSNVRYTVEHFKSEISSITNQ